MASWLHQFLGIEHFDTVPDIASLDSDTLYHLDDWPTTESTETPSDAHFSFFNEMHYFLKLIMHVN